MVTSLAVHNVVPAAPQIVPALLATTVLKEIWAAASNWLAVIPWSVIVKTAL